MLASVIAWAVPTLRRVTSEDVRAVEAVSLQSRSPGAKPPPDSGSVLARPLWVSTALAQTSCPGGGCVSGAGEDCFSGDFSSAEVYRLLHLADSSRILAEGNKAFEGISAGPMTFCIFAAAATRLSMQSFERNSLKWI